MPPEALEQRLLDTQLEVTQQHFATALDAAVPASLRGVALAEVCLFCCANAFVSAVVMIRV